LYLLKKSSIARRGRVRPALAQKRRDQLGQKRGGKKTKSETVFSKMQIRAKGLLARSPGREINGPFKKRLGGRVRDKGMK